MSKYRNHVLLDGLDEARAHQRGEKVGRRVKSSVTSKKDESEPDWPRNKDGTLRRRNASVSDEVKREAALEPGETRAVAERMGFSISAVWRWKDQLARGLL